MLREKRAMKEWPARWEVVLCPRAPSPPALVLVAVPEEKGQHGGRQAWSCSEPSPVQLWWTLSGQIQKLRFREELRIEGNKLKSSRALYLGLLASPQCGVVP